MAITLSVLMVVLPVGAMNLDSLQGKWTASVRMDNLFRINTYFHASVHSDYYEDPYYGDAEASAYLYSEQSASCGFPTEYSILWRIKKDIAVGLDGKVRYEKSPRGEYEYKHEDYRRQGEYSGSSWTGSLALEIYKYFKKDKFISPFTSIAPFISQSHSETIEKGTRYQDGDTTSYHYTRTRDAKKCGVDLNCGAEVFFRLFRAQMGLRMKSTLARFWRNSYEYSRNSRSDYTSEENPFGVDFYLPSKGNFGLWLCFYF